MRSSQSRPVQRHRRVMLGLRCSGSDASALDEASTKEDGLGSRDGDLEMASAQEGEAGPPAVLGDDTNWADPEILEVLDLAVGQDHPDGLPYHVRHDLVLEKRQVLLCRLVRAPGYCRVQAAWGPRSGADHHWCPAGAEVADDVVCRVMLGFVKPSEVSPSLAFAEQCIQIGF